MADEYEPDRQSKYRAASHGQPEPPAARTWAPWFEYAPPEGTIPAELPIAGPPCPDCRFWAPRHWVLDRNSGRRDSGKAIGVICCHAAEQERDFSCFKARPEPAPPPFVVVPREPTEAMVEAFRRSPLTCPARGDLVTMGTWIPDDAELKAALRAMVEAAIRK